VAFVHHLTGHDPGSGHHPATSSFWCLLVDGSGRPLPLSRHDLRLDRGSNGQEGECRLV